MFQVTYKNILKKDKEWGDFMRWLKVHWPIQQTWGATSVKFWNEDEGDKNLVFCRYTVENIDQWNRNAAGPQAETLVQALNEVVNLNQMSIKITAPTTENA